MQLPVLSSLAPSFLSVLFWISCSPYSPLFQAIAWGEDRQP